MSSSLPFCYYSTIATVDPTMKSFAVAVSALMATSAMAFAPSSTSESSTAMKAMPDRMWDKMVDPTERSASLPWLPREIPVSRTIVVGILPHVRASAAAVGILSRMGAC